MSRCICSLLYRVAVPLFRIWLHMSEQWSSRENRSACFMRTHRCHRWQCFFLHQQLRVCRHNTFRSASFGCLGNTRSSFIAAIVNQSTESERKKPNGFGWCWFLFCIVASISMVFDSVNMPRSWDLFPANVFAVRWNWKIIANNAHLIMRRLNSDR